MVVTESQPDTTKDSPKKIRPFKISLGILTKHNMKQFRIINECVFPVEYNNNFYMNILNSDKYCRLAYFNDIIVGAICYRFDYFDQNGVKITAPTPKSTKKCYIMTLGCLSQYRELGVGSKLLNHAIRTCQKLGNVESIYLHVHTTNETGQQFYTRRKFAQTKLIPDYYLAIEPKSAYELEKKLADCSLVNDSDDDFE